MHTLKIIALRICILLPLFVVLTNSPALAQQYLPMEVGTAYTYRVSSCSPSRNTCSYYISYMTVDSSMIFEGKEYFRFHGFRPYISSMNAAEWLRFEADSQRVYMLRDDGDYLLFDFSLSVDEEHVLTDRLGTTFTYEIRTGKNSLKGDISIFIAYGAEIYSYSFVDGLGLVAFARSGGGGQTSSDSRHSLIDLVRPGQPVHHHYSGEMKMYYTLCEDLNQGAEGLFLYLDAEHPVSRPYIKYAVGYSTAISYIKEGVLEYRYDNAGEVSALSAETEEYKRFEFNVPLSPGAERIEYRFYVIDKSFIPDTTWYPEEGFLEYEFR